MKVVLRNMQSKCLKIAIALDDSLDYGDGVQQYVLTLGSWLANQGHEVHYLVGRTKKNKDIKNLHSLAWLKKAKVNGNIVRTPLPYPKSKLKKILQKHKFDVIHAQMPCSPFFVGRIIKLAPKRTAIIGTYHILPYSLKEKIGAKLIKFIMPRVVRRVDLYIAVSQEAKIFLKKSWDKNSVVLPNVIDLRRFKVGKPTYVDKKPVIVFLGRLVERKGLSTLLKALYELKYTIGNFQWNLLVAGVGPDSKKLKKIVLETGLEDQVKFLGRIDEKDKANFLASASVAVFPATGGESFGIVLAEAMGSGAKVVLAGDNPGYRCVMAGVKDALFNPKDIDNLANLIEKSLMNPVFIKKINSKQQKIIKDFDVNVVGVEIVNKYFKVLAKKNPSKYSK